MGHHTIDDLLRLTVERNGSDLHLKADSPPLVRIYGDLLPVEEIPPLPSKEVRRLAYSIMSDAQRHKFEAEWELDMAHVIEQVARFRVNAFVQRGHVGVVFRVIPIRIQTMEELMLPPVCRYFADRPRGLVLVTGPAGSGKSTTQAAMIDYINKSRPEHIVTVEDPVEFLHEDVQALINQRELETDTRSFSNALKYVLRQDPDVILVGEMRDLETIHLAITAAETGHLVFGTLHTPDAVQTIDRVIDVFPMHQQQEVRMQLAVNLVGVVSQTLLKRKDGKGRVAAFETLVAIPSIRNLIREAKTFQIGSMIQTGAKQGMITLDQYLASLVKKDLIDRGNARMNATNPREFDALLEDAELVRR
ncbi:MAG: type IV pili twitching motility protein PilT [Armatimonadetes bacterium RBG_16_58_9]|nr:MAG: type IV pili twitching motility protein PilT [Armatimonadetes bacterium RBG_16_58_9]